MPGCSMRRRPRCPCTPWASSCSSRPAGRSSTCAGGWSSNACTCCAPFRRRLVEDPLQLGDPHWIEDPDFSIDNHLRRVAIPSPGGMRELAALVGDVASRLLDRSKPLWELAAGRRARGAGRSRWWRRSTTPPWTAADSWRSSVRSSTSTPDGWMRPAGDDRVDRRTRSRRSRGWRPTPPARWWRSR